MYEIDRVLIAKSKRNKRSILSIFWNIIKTKLFGKKRYKAPKFSGWGMDVNHSPPPWEVMSKKEDKLFLQANQYLLELINDKKFNLTQFNYPDTNYKKILDELKWRHYVLFNCCFNLIKDESSSKKNIVECGVCDGLTFFFIAQCLEKNHIEFDGYLYDSWSEFSYDKKKDPFDYSYLNVEITKNNLLKFKDNLFFNEGNIPQVFEKSKNPDKIDFLHIDLNSSKATKDTLSFFFNKISVNGVIIFDDYGRMDLEKEVIDNFLNNKKGKFIPLPTGQALFIKL